MTKADWIKLAMPASITLLAISIITVPMIAYAMSQVEVVGNKYGRRFPVYVKLVD